MEFALLGLILLAIPFVLPIAGWVSASRLRRRVTAIETVVLDLSAAIDRLHADLLHLREAGVSGAAAPAAVPPEPTSPPVPGPPESADVAAAIPAPRHDEAGAESRPPVSLPLAPVPLQVEDALAAAPTLEPSAAFESAPPFEPAPEHGAVEVTADRAVPPAIEASPEPPAGPPGPPTVPPRAAPAFDWESLIGVKLFAGIAGVALVIAAVSFLRYSVDQGWLQPPVRVAIGVIVSVVLLVLCELKAARQYPATANALDGAAVAILFATFFAAHALWNLIPAPATFALLAVVTALAVLLSIRRESLFIAVLGLLGGFATPALLSTGENRPIPLFAYLLLLNIGLAWVANRQVWPVLTWLTLGLTTLYQVVWVARFLDASQLPLAMGVFLVFPVASAAALLLSGRSPDDSSTPARSFSRTAMLSAVVPLLFLGYLSSVPEFGANAPLLLGFLLIVDAGLMAIAIARRMPITHALGAVGTIVVLAVWVTSSYVIDEGWKPALIGTSGFVALYLAALPLARRFGRPFEGAAVRTGLAAPLSLLIFPALAGIEPAFVHPLPAFGTLLVLLVVIAWRAAVERQGSFYYVASFFAIATQAIWSASYLTDERLGTAVAIYALFGLVAIAAPVLARRSGRPLQPAWGSGAVLLVSLVLLTFLSLGPISHSALWALALLLAIMNAGLFVDSASGGLPRISQIGSLMSWGLLAIWWRHSAGTIGVLPSLLVMTGLSLLTLAGYAWSARRSAAVEEPGTTAAALRQGLYLALVGQGFLYLIAANREWSLPPWPIFGALAVMTLGTSAASLLTRMPALHAAGAVAAALVIISWAGAAGSPVWGLTVVLAAAAVSAYALAWIRLAEGSSEASAAPGSSWAARGAAVVLFAAEGAVLTATVSGARPPFGAALAIHVAQIVAILVLTAWAGWRFVAIAAVVPAWLALAQWQQLPADTWRSLLIMAAALYAPFVAYPIVLGERARRSRDPYLAAVLASAMFFFAGRHAFNAGGLGWSVGAVPLAIAAVLALLLRRLLRLEPEGERDLARLALVAGAALAFVTIAIPLQLDHQWITIGWALEGAALAWLFRRIPHRGLLYFAIALLGAVLVRLVVNPEILLYEPRGATRILNWYLYGYLICAAAMFAASWWLAPTNDRLISGLPRVSAMLPAAGVILLFVLLNIEIADYYTVGPTITFRFGTTVSQDLTYTIGWLAFGMVLLAAGIYAQNRPARSTAVSLIAVTTLKCFLYDLSSLGGLYRVGSFVGLAFSLALVSLALKKYVLVRPADAP